MASNLTPGTEQAGTLSPAANTTIATGSTLKPGYVNSVTQNPCSNVEAGRTQAKSAYVTVNNSGADLAGGDPAGTVFDMYPLGALSEKADGTYTEATTTVAPAGGTGATLTYTVVSDQVTEIALVAGGTGYSVNDIITVADDTGVSVTVTFIV